MNDSPIGQEPHPPSSQGGHAPRAGGAGLGVPLSVWPGLPRPRSGIGPCPGPVTAAAAARIIAGFSFPGDLIAAPDGSAEVTHAAWAASRRVLDRTACLAALLGDGQPGAGRAVLAIAGRHGPGCCPGGPEPEATGDGPLYAAAYRVLVPGGILAVITDGAHLNLLSPAH